MESKSEKRPRVPKLSLRDVKRSSRLLGKTAPKSDSNYQLNSTALERQTLYEFLLRSATGDMNLLKKVIFCNKRSFNLITRGHLLRLQKIQFVYRTQPCVNQLSDVRVLFYSNTSQIRYRRTQNSRKKITDEIYFMSV